MKKKLERELELRMKINTISKVLPKSWRNIAIHKRDGIDTLKELGDFCMLLYNNLLYIKEDYKSEFNVDNTYTIDEYIDLFNSVYEKIFLELAIYSSKIYKQKIQNNDVNFLLKQRFAILKDSDFQRKRAFKGLFSPIMSFRKDTYKKLLPLVKKLFMIEKMCSFTTRKFWKNELTPIDKLDLKKPFKILVKVIFPFGWRNEKVTPKLKEYYDSRIYTSASLIDQDHMHNMFNYADRSNVAVLIMRCDENDIVCANICDSYSEELIDDVNPFKNKSIYSDIFLQDVSVANGKKHKIYAEAIEIATPKSILKNCPFYSEISLKNAEVVGVLVPNKYSLAFSKQTAIDYDVPLFFPKNLNKKNDKHFFYENLFKQNNFDENNDIL